MSGDNWVRVEHWQDNSGHAKNLGELWSLHKGTCTAKCLLQGHPLGVEARIEIDEELNRTQAFRDSKAMTDMTATWREAFKAKGWQPIAY